VPTLPVTIPDDSQFYLINQYPLASKIASNLKGRKGIDRELLVPEGKLPFQLHEFIGTVNDDEGMPRWHVADWVVAERLFFGRGQVIGRADLEVETTEWSAMEDEFVPATTSIFTGKGKVAKTKDIKGIRTTFGADDGPVLVDFWGKRLSEGNIEALVWGKDGNLTVHNAYDDSARPERKIDRENNPAAAERMDRYQAWVESVRAAQPQRPTGPVSPLDKLKKGPGKGSGK
jgi:hypothetical protein